VEQEVGAVTPKVGPQMPEIGVGVGLLILAAIVGWQTSLIPQSAYAKVSPSLVPWGITLALAVCGALLVVAGVRGGWAHEEGWALEWRALQWLGAGMIFNLTFIEGVGEAGSKIIPPLGFILCSVVLFVCTARAFGSQKFVRDIIIAFLFSLTAYSGFDGVLGYKIGAGGLDTHVSNAIDSVHKALIKGAR
jgi:putative tricarboxylic transport membrane protein